MTIKLLALDLDGTLVANLRTISPRTYQTIQHVINQGVLVTLATGREYQVTMKFAQKLNINAPLICYQGGLVRNYQTHDILLAQTISSEVSRQIIKFARQHKFPMLLYTSQNAFTELPSNLMIETFAQAKSPFLTINNLLTAVDESQLPLKFLFIQKASKSGSVYEALNDRFGNLLTITKSLETMVEATVPNTSKGAALAYLADYLNISLAQTMAIGDQDNDITMLQMAGLGVAMGNASAGAKEAADVIAPSITEDGAAWAMKKYILGEPV